MVTSSSFVIDDTCLLQLVQRWLHIHDCSGSECHSLTQTWVGGERNSSSNLSRNMRRWYSFQLLRLDSSWWTSSSILQTAWTGIRTRGTNHLNNFESEDILWNPSQEMNSKWYLFGDKGEGVVNQGKGVVDLGSGIKQKIVKEKLGQYTKTENFTFAKIRRCKWKEGQVE